MRNIAVLGATGSIGGNTLDVIARHPERFRASVLTAHRQVEALVALCAQHRPELAVIAGPDRRNCSGRAPPTLPYQPAGRVLALFRTGLTQRTENGSLLLPFSL